NLAKVDSLHTAIGQERLAETNNVKYGNAIGLGASIAGALMTWVNNDNFAQTRSMIYMVPSRSENPAFWEPTGSVTSPLEPYWGQIRPFCMASGTACYVPSQIPYNTDENSGFYQAALEVYNTGVNLTQEQKNIASWWADGPGATPTPPGHWLRISHQMINEMDLGLDNAAEIYMLVGLCVGDAFISCWDAKYRENLLRPVTYIRENIDPNWNTYISTPPFPEYTSGHSVCSGAAAEILTNKLGNIPFTDASNTFLGIAPRSFASFNDAAEEAAFSRLYGGIHYREGIVLGVQQGRIVAQTVLNRIKLEKN
ncbi:MAG: vanadium-dependent haloperoxidase, partial [Bacteroidia bacterium]